MVNEFGGDWTTEKLSCLKNYLSAYVKILKKYEYFKITYVDAFAGSGYITQPCNNRSVTDLDLFNNEYIEAQRYLEGSTKIALSIEPSFDQYIFIEKDQNCVTALSGLKTEFPQKSNRIQIENTDANTFLSSWCSKKNFWKNNRAVVFLDPYGMQVTWKLLETIADTQSIDLWLLFPLIGVNRMLTKNNLPPDNWSDILTKSFGTEEWKSVFYKKETALTLFGEEESEYKIATINKIGEFFINRLETIFCKVVSKPLLLCNSLNSPLYLLCFAASNPKGAPTAVKIANAIINTKSQKRSKDVRQ